MGPLSRSLALLSVALTSMLPAQADTPSTLQPSLWAAQPDVAAFDRSIDDHLAKARASIARLVAVKGARTVENSLQPYDDAIRELNTAAYAGDLMSSVHTDEAFRDHATEALVKASALQSEIQLDPRVYHALAAIDTRGADAATQHYVSRQLLQFRLAGVDKDAGTRAELKRLNDALTEQVATYDRNIADDVRRISVSPAELDGLPADYIAAHAPGINGQVLISTTYPDANPVYTYAKSASVRRKLALAFDNRGYPKNAAVLRDMMTTRERIAKLLGFAHWADYFAADQMIGNGTGIGSFIAALDAAARAPAEREFQMLLAEKRKADPEATGLSVDETSYYSELLRRAAYDFDSQSVRPYFPYERVKQGIIDTAAALFHVNIEREANVPVWDPSVESWLVREQGRVIGRIYLDMHPREGKFSHAAMFPVLDGVRERQLPEAVLVCNFPAPAATDAGLMSINDVTTFFHEFGHVMHHVLGGHQRWAGISGITMESDFAEAPSQMLEELIRSPAVLARFAKHYQTGEPIPRERVDRMNRASAFGRALRTQIQLLYTAVSYDLYRLPAASTDPDAVWAQDAKRHTLVAPVADTHQWASFGHLGGYSSAYYTYQWDKVIALDFYRQFDPVQPLEGEVGMRYRKAVLDPGGSQSAKELVKNFLGRPQDVSVLTRWIQEEFATAQ